MSNCAAIVITVLTPLVNIYSGNCATNVLFTVE